MLQCYAGPKVSGSLGLRRQVQAHGAAQFSASMLFAPARKRGILPGEHLNTCVERVEGRVKLKGQALLMYCSKLALTRSPITATTVCMPPLFEPFVPSRYASSGSWSRAGS